MACRWARDYIRGRRGLVGVGVEVGRMEAQPPLPSTAPLSVFRYASHRLDDPLHSQSGADQSGTTLDSSDHVCTYERAEEKIPTSLPCLPTDLLDCLPACVCVFVASCRNCFPCPISISCPKQRLLGDDGSLIHISLRLQCVGALFSPL